MNGWCKRGVWLRPLLAAAALCVALAWLPVNAGAVPPQGGKSAPAKGKADAKTPKGKGPKEKEPKATEPVLEPLDPEAVKELGDSGQVDPISGLGLRNPVCDKPGQIRSTQTRLSCQENGTPEGKYPSSNYGFDSFIDAGVDSPSGNFAKALVMVLNGIWLGLIFVLKLVLALLGLAFGLNPFSSGQSMQEITSGLSRIYRTITNPWLSVAIVAGGIWFAYKGLLRREFAAGVGGTLAGIAMLIVGLWVIHQPGASVGRVARVADDASLTVISAPRSGSLARPTGSFAEAMSQTWAQLVEVPFAGLNFSDMQWAMGPPPPEAVERANEKFCEDAGALALLATQADLGSDEAADACEQFAQTRYGKPRRVIDLYLRSSPGSPARKDLWEYFDKDEGDTYKAKVAAQGGDGVLTRLSMLVLFAVGLLGAVMLLAWLAIRLFTQAAIAFVLLMAAPFAVFFPLLGESGRRAFKTWGLTLLGASVAKLIYAAFLSVVLLGMTILSKIGDATGFLLACAFAWAVFLKRAELVGWMSVGDVEQGRAVSPIAQFLAFSGARRVTRTATGTVQGIGRRGSHNLRQRFSNAGAMPGEPGPAMLGKDARGVSDLSVYGAGQSAAGQPANRGATGTAGQAPQSRRASGAGSAGNSMQRGGGRKTSSAEAARETFERHEMLVTAAETKLWKSGGHGGGKDGDKAAAGDSSHAQLKNPANHAPPANPRRTRLEEMKGKERPDSSRDTTKAAEPDQAQRKAPSQIPGRVVSRSKPAKERVDRPKRPPGQAKSPQPQRTADAQPSTPKPPRLPRRTTVPGTDRRHMTGRR